MSFDSWLEAPYVRAAEQEAMFEKFCEEQGFDEDDPMAQGVFEQWLEDLEEDRELRMAEARAEARADRGDDV